MTLRFFLRPRTQAHPRVRVMFWAVSSVMASVIAQALTMASLVVLPAAAQDAATRPRTPINTPVPMLPGSGTNTDPPVLTLDGLPRPNTPPPERGPVVPSQVEGWRKEAQTFEYGEGVPRDAMRAAELYCRAARHGDPEAQYNLAWMKTNSRGIERNDAEAAHLFAAAAEQGFEQAKNILARMGEPRGPVPACLRPPDEDVVTAAAPPMPAVNAKPQVLPPPPPPRNAPEPIVRFVNLVAPEYKLQPALVFAIMATESAFDPNALSPKNAQGLMQLIPETAARFGVRNLKDPTQNIRGGMAYLRWLLAYFEGDVTLVSAAYNAGERAVERYLGVPPYAETRLYVLKIRAAAGAMTSHPFDASVTKPSDAMKVLRPIWRRP
jgi:Transglycosylase SLT domain/Sel1 repeat